MDIGSINTVCVVGWARTGIALCDLLLELKKNVLVTESGNKQDFNPELIKSYAARGVTFEFGGHSEGFIRPAQLAVLSPGVDLNSSPAVRTICRLQIPYTGELELAWRLTKARCVAITGTNGKTTTTTLVYEVLKRNCKRKQVFLGGNIGTPFSSFALRAGARDIVVLEVSSFQLETILCFRPFVAVLLNLEPDHLDRYRSFSDYSSAKMNIFKNQTADDFAVLNKNIVFTPAALNRMKAGRIYFNREFDNDNFSCVCRVAGIFGVTGDECRVVFDEFKGLPHRCQFVRSIDGVDFVNDSKATNPAACAWALSNIKRPVILIAGGKDKGLDYSQILRHARGIKKINLFGQAAPVIAAAVSSKIDCKSFSSLAEVVEQSRQDARRGDVVLFSPMCSSFDMFLNYEERGRCFTDIVNNLCDK